MLRSSSSLRINRLITAVGTVFVALPVLLVLGLMVRSAHARPEMSVEARSVTSPASEPTTVTLTAGPMVLSVDYHSTLTATVVDTDTTPVSGQVITFSTMSDLGNGSFNPVTETTDIAGQATSVVRSTLPGHKECIAEASNGVTGTITILFTAGAPAFITVTAVPTTVVADGASTATVTATVVDQYHNPVGAGHEIWFIRDNQFPPFATTDTDAAGQATATLVGQEQVGTVSVKATLSDLSVEGETTVDFVPGPLDHFIFDTIASSQTAGTPFAVTITAQDAWDNTVDYDGNASLSDQTGSVSPTTINFTDGSWSGDVTITQATAPGTDILSVGGGGKTGESNTFVINPNVAADLDVVVTPHLLKTNMQATVVATVTDQYGNRVADGVQVAFAADPPTLGDLDPATDTTTNGVATTTFTAGADKGSGVIQATIAGVPQAEANVEISYHSIYLPLVVRNYPPPWERGNGSEGMTIYHIAVCPDNPETLYAGTRDQGVSKSIDGGVTWTSSGLTGQRVYAPAVKPGSSCNIVYATTWGQGIQKSINGGASWAAANDGLGEVRLYFIVADPAGILYAATINGVFRSINDGTSWEERGLSGYDVQYLALDPDDNSRIFGGTWGGGILKTENSGATWDAVNTGLTGDKAIWGLSVAPGTGGQTVLAASNNQGVFISTNGGASWQRSWQDSYGQTVRTVLALDLGGHLAFFAGTDGQGVLSSTDGGNNWTDYSTGLESQTSKNLSAGNGYLYLGTTDGAWRRQLVY